MVTLPCYKEVGANVRDPDVFLGMTIALNSIRKVIPGPLSNPGRVRHSRPLRTRYNVVYDSPGIAQRSSWRAFRQQSHTGPSTQALADTLLQSKPRTSQATR